jgi:hypothetical protein
VQLQTAIVTFTATYNTFSHTTSLILKLTPSLSMIACRQVLGTGGDVDVTKLSMEESKFLGGDLEHTHLVRGLDYALLQKVRE